MRRRWHQEGIRVASYNIHGGVGRDRHFVPKRVSGVLAELNAAIVALQEVESRTTGFDMLAFLNEQTRFETIAGPTLLRGAADYGNGLLTRFPVASIRRLDISIAGHEPRGALDVELDCYGSLLRVLATHLGLHPAERRKQVRMLLQVLEEDKPLPTILLGDINEWFLWGRPLRWLHAHFEETPAPATFPAWLPFLALDRIWIKPRRLLQRLAVHRSRLARLASDHLPVTAEIGLEELTRGNGGGSESAGTRR